MFINGVAQVLGAETLSGSGVVIGAKGEILTNAHVVDACQTITVRLSSGNSEKGALIARDERNDLAVVRLTRTNISPASVAMFREGAPLRAGDAIVALGYPLSGLLAADANLSVGNVSALAGVADDSRYVQISAPVQLGNSGGPLLDASGHLVGIVTAKLDALRTARLTGDIPENVNFALKAEVARTFLDSKRIDYHTARSDEQLSPADVADIARPFTVHIECERVRSPSATALATPSAPATAEQIWQCRNELSSDLVINGCSAILQFDRSAWAFNNRGLAYYRQHDYDRAFSDLTEAVRLDPKYAIYRGRAYYEMRDYDRAIGDLTVAIQLDPRDADAYFVRADAYRDKGEYEHAIGDFSGVIRLNPRSASAYYERCWAQVVVSHLQEAVSDCNEALLIRPKYAAALDSRGFAYWKLGQLDNAIADFSEALKINSKLASSLYGHGLVKQKAGDVVGAKADMAAAKSIKPDIAQELARYGIK
jgi:tetratricopeptide (TPR) repeat protein